MNTAYLFIGLGGAIGAILRVALTSILPSTILNIPIKILCVNILGCFVLGLLTELMALHWNASLNMRHLLIQGLLAGFTTFSTFSLEFGLLYEKGFHISAILYAVLSVVLSIGFFFGGLKIIKIFS